jgi:thiosulfate dehydrogenase [quinone] large subunit
MSDRSTEARWTTGAFPAAALLPLRAFLGVTFVYAGIQKLSDPGFLHRGSRTFIGDQLRGFASHAPGGFLLRAFPLHHPALAGVAVALTEIGIGLLVLAGLATRYAAAGGLVLNLVLFLTASWHTSPYFLGSDIVFVFAWLPFVIAGAAGQPALDHELARAAARAMRPRRRPTRATATATAHSVPSPRELSTRRQLMARALAVTGVGALTLGGLASLFKGRYRAGAAVRHLGGGRGVSPSPGSPRAPSQSQSTAHRAAAPSPPQGGVAIGASSALSPGQAALYRDPGTGQADILIRQANGQLTAFSAICTHAGCQVSYAQGQLYCPCHGSVFDPRTGAVQQGPAVDPLPVRHVAEQGGRIYALRA